MRVDIHPRYALLVIIITHRLHCSMLEPSCVHQGPSTAADERLCLTGETLVEPSGWTCGGSSTIRKVAGIVSHPNDPLLMLANVLFG